jgi:hypothetical protein
VANKFYGAIGYGISEETSPGVWTNRIVERNYSGDVLKNFKKSSAGQSINDDIDVNNMLSILADPFALNHFHTILYVRWMGAVWKVPTAEVQYPRLLLSIGGVYNGETA